MTRRLALLVLLAAGVTLSAPATSAAPGDIDGAALVRVVNVAPATTVIDVQLADTVPQQLTFGSASSFVRIPADTGIRVQGESVRLEHDDPGCMDTVLMTSGDHGHGLVELPECSRDRFASGSTSIRFINGTAESGAVSLAVGSNDPPPAAPPFTSGDRQTAAAGDMTLSVRSREGERLGQRDVEALPDAAYSAIWAGGGETPLRLLWVEDGRQPHDPPPVDVPIDTDAPATSYRGSATVDVALTAAVTLLLGALTRRRRLGAVVIALLVLTGCAADSSGSAPPIAATIPTARVTPSPSTSSEVADPTHISLPAAAISAVVAPVDRTAGPALPRELPGSRVGWFRGTSRPGEPGVSLLVGHSVWRGEPGVFAELHEAAPGSRFEVTDAGGAFHTFTVVGQSVTRKGRLDPSLLAFSPEHRVLLITCTGPVDPSRGLRSQNLVVLAAAAGSPEVTTG